MDSKKMRIKIVLFFFLFFFNASNAEEIIAPEASVGLFQLAGEYLVQEAYRHPYIATCLAAIILKYMILDNLLFYLVR
jgi:hypothetical protein